MGILLTSDSAATVDVSSLLEPVFSNVGTTIIAVIGVALAAAGGVLAAKWAINWAINFFGGLMNKKN